jgi:hypothetical protein
MTMQLTMTSSEPRRLGRSIGAVLSGIFAGAALSLATDQVLHVLGVFAPWGEVTYEPGPYLLAIAYRCAYAVVGFYLVARLAPQQPMRHVWVAASVGLALSIAGVVAALTSPMGPIWYPLALALTTLPCAWLAGALRRRPRRQA